MTMIPLSNESRDRLVYLKKRYKFSSYDSLIKAMTGINRKYPEDNKYECHICKHPFKGKQNYCSKCGVKFLWN